MSGIEFPINVDREIDLSRELAGKPLAGLSTLDYDEFAVSSQWSWGDDTRYGFATGQVRAIEHRLISSARLLRLAEARDGQEALSMLGDTDYARVFQEELYTTNGSEASGQDIGLLLGREAARVRDFINGLTQDREATDILFVRDDFLNLKLALKGVIAGVEVGDSFAPLGLISPAVIFHEATSPEKPEGLPPYLARAALAATRAYADTRSPAEIDRVVDGLMFEHLLNSAAEKEIFFLHKLIRIEIDLINIITFFRLRWLDEPISAVGPALIKGGVLHFEPFLEFYPREIDAIETGFLAGSRYHGFISGGIAGLKNERSFVRMEGLVDGELLKFVDRQNEINFGVEVLIAYYYRKAIELRKLRTVLIGKKNGLSAPQIKEMLGYGG
jgi:V/A-type H+-transporting ATPase subunit C